MCVKLKSRCEILSHQKFKCGVEEGMAYTMETNGTVQVKTTVKKKRLKGLLALNTNKKIW